jgi:hypothetical protein
MASALSGQPLVGFWLPPFLAGHWNPGSPDRTLGLGAISDDTMMMMMMMMMIGFTTHLSPTRH